MKSNHIILWKIKWKLNLFKSYVCECFAQMFEFNGPGIKCWKNCIVLILFIIAKNIFQVLNCIVSNKLSLYFLINHIYILKSINSFLSIQVLQLNLFFWSMTGGINNIIRIHYWTFEENQHKNNWQSI